MSSEMESRLKGCRVLAAINGLELFGHEKGNIEVFKALRLMGAEVVIGVNAKHDGGAVGQVLRQLGFETFELPFCNQWSWQWLKQYPTSIIQKFRSVFQCSRIFHRKITEFKPTHIHLGSPLAYSFISLALVLNRVPLVYRMGDCPPIDSPFNMLIWRAAMKRADRRVANSEYVKRCVMNEGYPSHALIYNCSTVPAVSRSQTEAMRVSTQTVQPKIIYVGAVTEHKGLRVLVDAFARVAQLQPSLQLSIVGESVNDADFRRSLIQRVAQLSLEQKVTFHGFVQDPSSLYDAALIHVAPSIWEEPLGNVVMEAKARGIPSIVFPSGGLPEMIRHTIDGYVCSEKSEDALAAAMVWMISDATRLQTMRAAAVSDSVSRFGYPGFLSHWAQVYMSVGGSRV